MPEPFTLDELSELRRKFVAKQKALRPHLTFSMMAKEMDVSSPNSVTNVMEKFVELGWAEKVPWGENRFRYWIFEEEE